MVTIIDGERPGSPVERTLSCLWVMGAAVVLVACGSTGVAPQAGGGSSSGLAPSTAAKAATAAAAVVQALPGVSSAALPPAPGSAPASPGSMAAAVIQALPGVVAPAPAAPIQGSPAFAIAKMDLTFVDLDIFDREMVSALSSGTAEIEVAIVTGMSLSQISPRLGRWLNTVQEAGGRVQIMGAQRTRSVALVTQLGQLAFSSWQESRLRGLLKGVDAELTIADQKIERVVFRRRGTS